MEPDSYIPSTRNRQALSGHSSASICVYFLILQSSIIRTCEIVCSVILIEWAKPSELNFLDDPLGFLTELESARCKQFRHQADRGRFVSAWSLARRVLGELTGSDPRDVPITRCCLICGHPSHGKPRLLAGGWDFSLSHAGDRVVLAVTDHGAVGIDVETTDALDNIGNLQGLVLHPDESYFDEVDLLRMWVRKEALLKATGYGLAKPMNSFRIVDRLWGASVRDLDADEGYVAAIAEVAQAMAIR